MQKSLTSTLPWLFHYFTQAPHYLAIYFIYFLYPLWLIFYNFLPWKFNYCISYFFNHLFFLVFSISGTQYWINVALPLRENCPNMEFFLVGIFLYSDWIQKTVFGLNTGKYGIEKTPYLDTFHAVYKGTDPQSKTITTFHFFIKKTSRTNSRVVL